MLSLIFFGNLLHWVYGSQTNPFEVDSPWPSYHAGPARQASTALQGPTLNSSVVTVHYFRDDTASIWNLWRGEAFGTSPWHILSSQKYNDDPNARSLWGTSLTHVYKYVLSSSSGSSLQFVDSFRLNFLPFFVSWNFVGLTDGRLVVPAPNGLSIIWYLLSPCFTLNPALLIFRDGDTTDSNIQCVGKFAFSKWRLLQACGFSNTVFGTTTVNTNVLLTGEIVVQLRRNVGSALFGTQKRETWLAIVNNELTDIITCGQVTEDGTASNGSPMEFGSSEFETIYYIPTERELIASVYNSATNTLTPRQAFIEIGFRSGRTGTTPTLLGFDTFKFVLTVNSKCAVQNVFTGAIECDSSTDPSELIAVPRPLGSGPSLRIALPAFMETTENSPAVWDRHIVICNYSGYSPNGNKNGQPDRAVGLVKLSWNPTASNFQIDWQNDHLQCSGVPTISGGSNLVYFSGTESDLDTYFYGLDLDTGATVLRLRVGPSEDGNFFTGDRGVYDAGNNIIIYDDGSAVWPGGQNLVRISIP